MIRSRFGRFFLAFACAISFVLMMTYLSVWREPNNRCVIDHISADKKDFNNVKDIKTLIEKLESSVAEIAKQIGIKGADENIMRLKEIPTSEQPIVDGVIYPKYFKYVINKPSHICKFNSFSVFVYVHSAAGNFERRRAVRQTWANTDLLNRLNVGYVFMTGFDESNSSVNTQLEEESREYGDIIQSEHIDTYSNISIKSASSLNWAAVYCASHVPAILKTDDDMLVNISAVVRFVRVDLPLIKFGKGSKLLLCNLFVNSLVVRDHLGEYGRWYIPRELYKEKEYPPFCQGSAFLMTNKAVIALRHALSRVKIFPLDDVFLTGFVAAIAGVTHVPILSRYLTPGNGTNISPKDLSVDGHVWFYHVPPQTALMLWEYM